MMTENSGENIVGISYWEIFPSVKLSMHKWRRYYDIIIWRHVRYIIFEALP